MRSLFCLLVFTTVCSIDILGNAGTFFIQNDRFVRNGEEVRILSGELHYTRVAPGYWKDRLLRLRALGLNAVQTYVPWNIHQPRGSDIAPVFTGSLDLGAFLTEASNCGLMVLLRLGPYIDAEYDFGGLPAWLMSPELSVKAIRTNDTAYMHQVTTWWNLLLTQVEPHLWRNAGSVVMLQIENEYGAFAQGTPADEAYKSALLELVRLHLGSDVVVYSTDGDRLEDMRKGSFFDSRLLTIPDFGPGDPDFRNSDMDTAVELEQAANPTGFAPLFCSEFYVGWATAWNQTGGNIPSSLNMAGNLSNWLLRPSSSVNLYMAHGGTSFGWWAGADGGFCKSGICDYMVYETSYDFGAPIAEGGEHNIDQYGRDRFADIQMVLAPYWSEPLPAEPALPPRRSYGSLTLAPVGRPLIDSETLHALVLEGPTISPEPRTMEQNGGPWYGFALYEVNLPDFVTNSSRMTLDGGARDRVMVFMDGRFIGTLWRGQPDIDHVVLPRRGRSLQLLVENTGRIAYGRAAMVDAFVGKGLSGPVRIDGEVVLGPWRMWALPLDAQQLSMWPHLSSDTFEAGPRLFEGTFVVEEGNKADCWILMDAWVKGMVYINGISLGRYWNVGPSHSLYIPAPFLDIGVNNVLVLELHPSADILRAPNVAFIDRAGMRSPAGAVQI